MERSRKIKDLFRSGATYTSALLALALLISIFTYVLISGAPLLSWNLLSSNYNSSTYTYEADLVASTYAEPQDLKGYYSSAWGVSFIDDTSITGEEVISIEYLDPSSPLNTLSNKISKDVYFTKAFLKNEQSSYLALAKYKAEKVASIFNEGTSLTSFSISTKGGGIKGSLLSTLLLLGLTLLIAMPLGIGAAIYFVYFAPKNKKWVAILEKMIEVSSGIPSLIFGLVGAAVFIPLCNGLFATNGGSLISGSLTMVLILLPTITKTSEEALKQVPAPYREASLALGASERQTLYKTILPSALPGLLSGGVLAMGRIIGESAALVYAIGTYILDSASLTGSNAVLAVEIWSLLAGENPNYSLASAIALLILIVVFIISLFAKILAYIFKRKVLKA